MKIGVLALQGAVAEHIRSLQAAGAEAVAIKRTDELKDIDGLVLPGGESTTMGKLMRKYGFIDELREFSAQGKPFFGTCAGMVVLASEINGQDEAHLGLMDISVERNAFGRQRESFETDLTFTGVEDQVRAVFIRAPLITRAGESVEVLSVYNDEIVAARQGNLLAVSYHPELTDDLRTHRYFIQMVQEAKGDK